jgi:phosphoribosyl-AMP cyclohydrolase
MTSAENLLNSLKFDANGLVTAIAQDYLTSEILMVAHMNRDSLIETLKTGKAVYWSRSRQKLWQKGEESGNVQNVKAIYIDCDGDAVVLKVEQVGGASCHTGHRSCFYRRYNGTDLIEEGELVFDPSKVYKNL